MFRVNEELLTTGGLKAVVLKTDCDTVYSNRACPILAVVSLPTGIGASHGAFFYSDNGKYMGVGNPSYDLLSNQPNGEELALINQIEDICERSVENREEAILKVIRQLRKK